MVCGVLIVLWGTGGVLLTTEVRAGRPEGDLQEVGHLAVVFERLERLERKFDEEKQDWQRQKQQWQREQQDLQRQTKQLKHLTHQLQTQIISLQHKVEVLETGPSTSKDTTLQTPEVFSKTTLSSKKVSATTPKGRYDHHVLARADDVNPLEPVVSQMNQSCPGHSKS